jgi:hypothetical protein
MGGCWAQTRSSAARLVEPTISVVGHPRRCLGAGIQLSPVAMFELQRQPSVAAAVEQPMDDASHAGSMHVRVRKIY